VATSKSGSSTRNGRDSHSKRLGCKVFGGSSVSTGMIVMRQRGTKFHAGVGAGLGVDHTVFARRNGKVQFRIGLKGRTFIDIV